MRNAALGALFLTLAGTASAQIPAPAPLVLGEPETIQSQAERNRSIAGEAVQSVLDPVYGVDGQYARWKHPICLNLYGLTPLARYTVESRIKQIARQVGAPVDNRDPCEINVTVAFTANVKATLDSIYKAVPDLLVDYGFMRNRLKQSQPIQAWYGISARAADGRSYRQLGDSGDPLANGPPVVHVADMNRLNTGISTAIELEVVVVDTNAVMGKSLRTVADYLALLTLAQARDTAHCKDVPSIANLMFADCDPAYRPESITAADIAMLSGLYQTQDETLQVLQRQHIVGAMSRALKTP